MKSQEKPKIIKMRNRLFQLLLLRLDLLLCQVFRLSNLRLKPKMKRNRIVTKIRLSHQKWRLTSKKNRNWFHRMSQMLLNLTTWKKRKRIIFKILLKQTQYKKKKKMKWQRLHLRVCQVCLLGYLSEVQMQFLTSLQTTEHQLT